MAVDSGEYSEGYGVADTNVVFSPLISSGIALIKPD